MQFNINVNRNYANTSLYSSFIMVVQYLIIILVEIVCNYNVYFWFWFWFCYSLNAICYLMYIYLRLYFIYFVNNYFSGPLLITVLIVALIGLPCWNKGFSIFFNSCCWLSDETLVFIKISHYVYPRLLILYYRFAKNYLLGIISLSAWYLDCCYRLDTHEHS